MSNLDKDIDKTIERLKEDIDFNKNRTTIVCFREDVENVLSDRENWKKIAEKLAEVIDNCCDGENTNTDKYIKKYCKFEELQCLRKKEINCKQCIIDWARNEVENDRFKKR